MYYVYEDYLFTKKILVSSGGKKEEAFPALFALANLFGIHITEGETLADEEMIRTASRCIGRHVPAAFYGGFPDTVREMAPDALLFDQLLHYFETYTLGLISQPGKSFLEREFTRTAFREQVERKDFVILDEDDAIQVLAKDVYGLLMSSRPLNEEQYEMVCNFTEDFFYELPEDLTGIGKDTACRLILDIEDVMVPVYGVNILKYLQLSDVLRLVGLMQKERYGSENIRSLNLKNKDRKLIRYILDEFFEEHPKNCDVQTCLEKKKDWNGLLHHIHYSPADPDARAFVNAIRGKEHRSVYSEFEARLTAGDIPGAVTTLVKGKGTGALLRNLNYILSRCKTETEEDYVLANLRCTNPILLMQLIQAYSQKNADLRNFRFTRYRTLRNHRETVEEGLHRKTRLSPELSSRVRETLEKQLAQTLRGRLGRVYIDPAMARIGLPIQETTSSGGYGVLARGSRIPVKAGKKVRCFTYWEKVDDIDLSIIGMDALGNQREFSWRTMAINQTDAITFSGDQTNGYRGGSEFFDVDLDKVRQWYPDLTHLIFCNNVFSGTPFSKCICRAGYMDRDILDSGEIFEPKTVKTSFAITCESTFAYLFAIDLRARELVWLNLARKSSERVAGATSLDFLMDYLEEPPMLNMDMFFRMMAAEVVENPEAADIVVSDEALPLAEGAEQIRSCDFARILQLMNARE